MPKKWQPPVLLVGVLERVCSFYVLPVCPIIPQFACLRHAGRLRINLDFPYSCIKCTTTTTTTDEVLSEFSHLQSNNVNSNREVFTFPHVLSFFFRAKIHVKLQILSLGVLQVTLVCTHLKHKRNFVSLAVLRDSHPQAGPGHAVGGGTEITRFLLGGEVGTHQGHLAAGPSSDQGRGKTKNGLNHASALLTVAIQYRIQQLLAILSSIEKKKNYFRTFREVAPPGR